LGRKSYLSGGNDENRSKDFQLTGQIFCVLIGLLLVVATTFMATSGAQAAKPGSGTGSLPVSGTLSDGGTFEGTISDLDASVNEAGDLVVSGVLNGTATDATGTVTGITDQVFTTTATLDQGGACDILFLDLGPIFLDLLGLPVDLSEITLDVNAVPGAGNLLGNLLCAITGLLDNPDGTTDAIANLLDRIFDLLG
jgi:hypothetical protein